MKIHQRPIIVAFIVLVGFSVLNSLTLAQSNSASPTTPQCKMRCVTQAQREAAAARRNSSATSLTPSSSTSGTKTRQLAAAPMAMPMAVPGGTPDYFNSPNWTFSPPLRKFVDTLPGLGATNANNLGQYIPIAVSDKTTYPGSDFYQIGLSDYSQQMHSDLPPTKLRGYKDLNATGADAANHYLGPVIVAQSGKPVRIKFVNQLPTDNAGNLFLPVDKTVMGTRDPEPQTITVVDNAGNSNTFTTDTARHN